MAWAGFLSSPPCPCEHPCCPQRGASHTADARGLSPPFLGRTSQPPPLVMGCRCRLASGAYKDTCTRTHTCEAVTRTPAVPDLSVSSSPPCWQPNPTRFPPLSQSPHTSTPHVEQQHGPALNLHRAHTIAPAPAPEVHGTGVPHTTIRSKCVHTHTSRAPAAAPRG